MQVTIIICDFSLGEFALPGLFFVTDIYLECSLYLGITVYVPRYILMQLFYECIPDWAEIFPHTRNVKRHFHLEINF